MRVYFLILSVCMTLSAFAQRHTLVFAHRGYRGLMPENTISAMCHALRSGDVILEMDIAFSQDGHPVISHDPWLDHKITLDPEGKTMTGDQRIPLYSMPYELIRRYDVGSKQHPDFPFQQNLRAYIPRLADLIDSVEQFVAVHDLKAPRYCIETKSSVARDNKVQPVPEEFVKKMMEVIVGKGIENRVIIQSFDVRTLEIIKRDFPNIPTMLNVTKGVLEEHIAQMTFVPDIYAPAPHLIDESVVNACKDHGITLISGNSNNKAEIDRILNLGVAGYMSDYPYELIP